MNLYNIPGDDGKTKRKTDFLQLLQAQNGYVDGATDYCLLIPYAKQHSIPEESRFWLAYLYGLSYSGTTTIQLFESFPSLNCINPKDLKAFWKSEKDHLWFNPDKKYIKNNDQLIPAIKSLYKRSGGDLITYLKGWLKQGFDQTYKEIQANWAYFGPHGAYLFFDAIYGLCPSYYSDPSALDWKHCGKTVPEGMAHLLYMDEAIENPQLHDYERYNKIVKKLVQKSGQPMVIVESTLCAYRKLFKCSRYHGYYADRMLEECLHTEPYLKQLGIDIWDYRKQTIPKYLRGEANNWQGIRKKLLPLYVETGEIDA